MQTEKSIYGLIVTLKTKELPKKQGRVSSGAAPCYMVNKISNTTNSFAKAILILAFSKSGGIILLRIDFLDVRPITLSIQSKASYAAKIMPKTKNSPNLPKYSPQQFTVKTVTAFYMFFSGRLINIVF